MKRVALIFIAILSLAFTAFADPALWEKANKLYSENNFREAAKVYEQLLQEVGFSPELHYNLGNAYYKSNEIGLAILHYERALRLNPLYDDALHNLEFVNQKVIDNIEPENTFFLKKWLDVILKQLTPNTWFVLAIPLFLVCLMGFLIFIFGKTRGFRKSGFYVGIILLVSSVVCIAFSGVRAVQMKAHNEGVIMTGAVVVKSAPDKSGTNLFQLHEGTKVLIEDSLGDWYEVKLSNGNVGWIEKINIEKI